MNEVGIYKHTQLSTIIDQSLYSRFIEYIDAKPKTIETYTKGIKRFKAYTEANNINKPQRRDVINYRDDLLSQYKPATVRSYMNAVKLFFKWLNQEGIYPNVAENIKSANVSNTFKKDYLTSEQVKDILLSIDTSDEKGKRDYALFALTVTCGLRTIELQRANVNDIRTLGNNTVLYIQGKGRDEKGDYEKIMLPVQKCIKDYLSARELIADEKGEVPLFTRTSNNGKGKRMTTRSISQILKDCMVNAGYDSERLTAHSLRHTAVTLALLAGEDIAQVQQFARHKSINTTMIYNHAIDEQKNNCSNAITNAIF
ncbi:tyrosine-type recombinase/integrase [Aerococcus suis]